MHGVLAGLLLLALPSAVNVKGPDRSFSFENDYALQDGRLWVKPRDAAASGWKLFEGTGVPSGKDARSFAPGDRIESFSTEGLMVVALSSRGRFYLWQPTLNEPIVWAEKVGQPFPGALEAPPHRDWAFSMSVNVAPKKRRTPMHDIDSWYEDAVGNRIEFGFTATIYVLDPDGQRIRYWDTGLPPAFYKAFATPERGRFVAERLSASGSTIFVVDRAGRMFTRMMDYEMNGACPGLRYTFEKKKAPGDRVLPLFEAERVLPLEGWRPQPKLPLSGAAEATTRISIHLTGKGNAARELRVQGKDAQGRLGYWFKPIFGAAWEFKETGEPYEPGKVVSGSPVAGRPLDKNYAGTLAPYEVQLVDFDYYDTPATLRFEKGGRTWDVALHTFDAWGPTVEQKEHPALVGSPFGEPKLLVGTLEVPDEMLASADAETKALVDAHLRRFHRAHQAFAVAADDARVELKSRLWQRAGLQPLDYALRAPLDVTLTRTLTAEDLGQYEAIDLVHLTQASGLLVADGETDRAKIREALRENKALLAWIEKETWRRRAEHLQEGLVSAAAGTVFVPINALADALTLPSRVPVAGGLALTGGHVFQQYAEMNLKRVLTTPQDAKAASEILERRIREYERRAR